MLTIDIIAKPYYQSEITSAVLQGSGTIHSLKQLDILISKNQVLQILAMACSTGQYIAILKHYRV